jgi:diguanylate cyclase (GGDEF)-like protein
MPGEAPKVGQISCSMPSVLLRHVRARLGDEAVARLLEVAGVDHTPEFLNDLGNWIWYDEAVAMFEAAVQVTGDTKIARWVGEETVRQHAGTAVATLFRSLGSPERVYDELASGVTKFSTVTDLRPVEVEPGKAVIRACARAGFQRHRHMCDWTIGMLSQPPALFGLPPASVKEERCELRGDDHCLYVIEWDADRARSAADPHELVTALEAQLVAMTDRLDSVYATARDLIALEDLDGALKRITERAATAVRAPSYLLAVRVGAGGELHVHHRGLEGHDVDRRAHELLEGHIDAADGSALVAEVASGGRHYGRLMAASPAGEFLPNEQELFDVYARYAAAVLDTATALDEARHRHAQSRALLELSQAVAAAGTGEEVAERLAEAVPDVVDCDRVVVFLWRDEARALSCGAVAGADEETADFLRQLEIRATDTHHLARLVASPDPSPLFFAPDTEDAFVGGVMRRLGSVALIIVPVVANEHFYGVLAVSVNDDPERLASTAGLLDRLAGVVAQAATALDNARLIETMFHQARVDNLTGLLGHRAFQESLEEALRSAEAEPFTLATIDIDDFKLINDANGHPAGDEALRQLADALRLSVRGRDAVFRVGGDEFAILLPGLSAPDAVPLADRLRTAVTELQLDPPLSVSVGLASWPADAADRDELLERADDALYAAKRAGKGRTWLAAVEPQSPARRDLRQDELLELLRNKDADTAEHSERVAALAWRVGTALGLEEDRLADLRIAGELHDVGKIAVPDRVLNKPGPLDEEEMRLVRTHPVVGAELVRSCGLERCARSVREHHERIDGKGYPEGLGGDEITLEGRILHAVDAYAAMTSERPYCCEMSQEDALEELTRNAGTQFDPEVVTAIARVLQERPARAA